MFRPPSSDNLLCSSRETTAELHPRRGRRGWSWRWKPSFTVVFCTISHCSTEAARGQVLAWLRPCRETIVCTTSHQAHTKIAKINYPSFFGWSFYIYHVYCTIPLFVSSIESIQLRWKPSFTVAFALFHTLDHRSTEATLGPSASLAPTLLWNNCL